MRKFSTTTEITMSDAKIDFHPRIITRLEAPGLEVPLGSLTERPSEEAITAIGKNTGALAALVADLNEVLWHDALVAARSAAQTAVSRYEDARQHLADIGEQLRKSKPAHYLRLLLSFLFGLMALVGEYALTWSTLPALLMIEKDSLLGLALGIIPVAAAKALERPLGRLFQLLTYWNRSSRLWLQSVALSLELLLILGIVWSNYAMVRSLAPAREEAMKVMQCLESGACTDATVNHQIIYQAILAVSLVVVLDAALFFLMIDEEYRRMTCWLGLKREQKRWLRAFEATENSLGEAKRVEDREAHIWDTRQERKDALVQAMKSRDEFLLARLPDRLPDKPQALHVTVEELLTPAPASRRGSADRHNGHHPVLDQSPLNGTGRR